MRTGAGLSSLEKASGCLGEALLTLKVLSSELKNIGTDIFLELRV